MAPVHVLETQGDPAALVVGPEQARHRSGDGKRRHDPRLTAVQARGGRGRRLADRPDEHAAGILEAGPWREARGEISLVRGRCGDWGRPGLLEWGTHLG